MKTLSVFSLSLAGFALVATLLAAQGQSNRRAAVLVPDSTRQRREDVGVRAHTNHLVLQLSQSTASAPAGESPQQIYPVYGLTFTGGGGNGTIAIVDAFDYPTATADLGVFSTTFGLPRCDPMNQCLKIVYADGRRPMQGCGWSQEAALDIEWAHAMAPNAKIVLVEATSNTFGSLFRAVNVASHMVNVAGADVGTGLGEVSMSWGGSEFNGEASLDSHFTTPGVVYFAASGDAGGKTMYPCVSPNVVCVGGTTIRRDYAGNFLGESAWRNGGGGPSQYELLPYFQGGVTGMFGPVRGVPDVSFDADPHTGVAVYDSTPCHGMSGWMVFGGTSVGSPAVAGMVNRAGNRFSNSPNELTAIYSNLGTSNVRDITAGMAGLYPAMPGWDYATGVGSVLGSAGN